VSLRIHACLAICSPTFPHAFWAGLCVDLYVSLSLALSSLSFSLTHTHFVYVCACAGACVHSHASAHVVHVCVLTCKVKIAGVMMVDNHGIAICVQGDESEPEIVANLSGDDVDPGLIIPGGRSTRRGRSEYGNPGGRNYQYKAAAEDSDDEW
jgi:hypothetical protein